MSHARERGFTLIEMVAVIAVITIIMGILLANFRGFDGTARLEEDAANLASLIRKARQNSISVVQHGPDFPSYGVYVDDDSTVELYAACGIDLASGDSYEKGGDGDGCSSGEVVETLELKGSTVTDITHTHVAGPVWQRASILFVRPDPIVLMYKFPPAPRALQPTGTLTITLTENDGAQTRTISVNSGGHVRVQ